MMDCCSCFGLFGRKRSENESLFSIAAFRKRLSQEHLLGCSVEDLERRNGLQASTLMPANCHESSFAVDISSTGSSNGQGKSSLQIKHPFKELKASDISNSNNGRKASVKETYRAIISEDFDGNKMINEYVRECKIGTGSYGKVVLHRSKKDGKRYAIKVFHKARLQKVRVAPSETAMTDVLREVSIMKQLDHPNIASLIEVIDDPESDHFYMVLEYVEGRRIFEGSGPVGGIGEAIARTYFRDVVAGLMYLHGRNIMHGDIKPENLLVSGEGHIKIGDFSISRMFEDDNDEMRRSPGTPVFTAPECCQGLTYRGKAADRWALGVTLYCMVLGCYPFIGDTLQDTYDKIVNDPLYIPEEVNPDLANLLQGLLCKDPNKRISLDIVAQQPWVVKGYGSLQHAKVKDS
eukprot:c24700_g1_i3 orf=485-1702(+)